MSKITPDHLARQAVVYIRQSTAGQVASNLKGKRRQYGLADRARQLVWNDVAVIDDDLGRSGGGDARPGFEKQLAAICEGQLDDPIELADYTGAGERGVHHHQAEAFPREVIDQRQDAEAPAVHQRLGDEVE